ncbi:MAG: glycosyltransferase family 2 protein [Candidatus Thermoplasmatota archaeon]|nr:glycosyltransferase family 2 protein [Candidatus Thermoplasmatota archaeon]
MEKLSILMNSYNRHEIIGHALDSILGSDLPEGLELEVVVIDDHSDQETWNVLKKYSDDQRVMMHRNKENIGSGSLNWNKGYEIATGDIIMVTADDMIWDRSCIRYLYRELKKHDRYTCVVGIYINTESIDDLPEPTLKVKEWKVSISQLTGIPTIPTDGKNEHVTRNLSFCYRDFYEGLDELFHHFPVNGMREETDQYLRIMKLRPKRKIVVVDRAVRYHVHTKKGGYRMDLKRYKRWTRKNHRSYLIRNFGWKVVYMVPIFHIWLAQKWFRDLIGKYLIEPKKNNIK